MHTTLLNPKTIYLQDVGHVCLERLETAVKHEALMPWLEGIIEERETRGGWDVCLLLEYRSLNQSGTFTEKKNNKKKKQTNKSIKLIRYPSQKKKRRKEKNALSRHLPEKERKNKRKMTIQIT